jgi:hypothetical protein
MTVIASCSSKFSIALADPDPKEAAASASSFAQFWLRVRNSPRFVASLLIPASSKSFPVKAVDVVKIGSLKPQATPSNL